MKKLAIWIFCILYLLVSFVSTIHIIAFFELSNSHWLSVTLGIAFELGSAASLVAVAALDRSNKYIIWGLFAALTLFQIQANMFVTFANVKDYKAWVDLFGLSGSSEILQKRVLSIVAGAILPIVALGFVKSLVDYMKPDPAAQNEPVSSQDDVLDHVPTDEEIAAALARQNRPAPVPEPGPTKQYVDQQATNTPVGAGTLGEATTGSNSGPFGHAIQADIVTLNPFENVTPDQTEEKVDDQVLKNRELAAQLVTVPEAAAPAEIDNQTKTASPALSSDARISRGMSVKV